MPNDDAMRKRDRKAQDKAELAADKCEQNQLTNIKAYQRQLIDQQAREHRNGTPVKSVSFAADVVFARRSKSQTEPDRDQHRAQLVARAPPLFTGALLSGARLSQVCVPSHEQRVNVASPALDLLEVGQLQLQRSLLTCPARYYPEEKHCLEQAYDCITTIKYQLLKLAGHEKDAWNERQLRRHYDRLRQD